MKIVLVSPLPPPEGGIATWTVKYRKYCNDNNIELTVVNNALNGKRAKAITNRRKLFNEIGRTRRIVKQLRNGINSNNPDIVHINSSCTPFGVIRDYLLVQISKKMGVKTVVHCRCNVEDQLKTRLSKVVFKNMVRLADMIFTLNTPSQKYVENIVNKKAKRIPNFIDNEQILNNRFIKECIKGILFVGHVKCSKGAREICEVAQNFPQYHFTLIGPVEDECKSLSWSNNTTLTGAQDSSYVKEKLKTADLFLFPTYTEGFSNAIAEAMAAGIPIITTDVGANRDMIEDKGGIIVPVKDTQSIKNAINIMSDYKTRIKMSTWNINKVKEYLVDSVMEALFTAYNEALEDAR